MLMCYKIDDMHHEWDAYDDQQSADLFYGTHMYSTVTYQLPCPSLRLDNNNNSNVSLSVLFPCSKCPSKCRLTVME